MSAAMKHPAFWPAAAEPPLKWALDEGHDMPAFLRCARS
jgi:hypothetical protein